jgi:hypothetical protein
MAKTVIIRLTCSGGRTGPFDISDNLGTVLGTDIPKQILIDGYTVSVADAVTTIIIQSQGKCSTSINVTIGTATIEQLAALDYTVCNTGSIWKHLDDTIQVSSSHPKAKLNSGDLLIEYILTL